MGQSTAASIRPHCPLGGPGRDCTNCHLTATALAGAARDDIAAFDPHASMKQQMQRRQEVKYLMAGHAHWTGLKSLVRAVLVGISCWHFCMQLLHAARKFAPGVHRSAAPSELPVDGAVRNLRGDGRWHGRGQPAGASVPSRVASTAEGWHLHHVRLRALLARSWSVPRLTLPACLRGWRRRPGIGIYGWVSSREMDLARLRYQETGYASRAMYQSQQRQAPSQFSFLYPRLHRRIPLSQRQRGDPATPIGLIGSKRGWEVD